MRPSSPVNKVFYLHHHISSKAEVSIGVAMTASTSVRTDEVGRLAEEDQDSLLRGELLSERLRNMVDMDSFQELSSVQALADTLRRQAQEEQGRVLRARRMKALKVWGEKFTDFADKSMSFLNSFSGILQIATGIDSRFGPIAYGTVAVLLTVASNKKQQDELITTMLSKFTRLICRVERLGALESNNAKIRGLSLDIYVRMITLLRAAAQYYAQKTWGRILDSIFKPPKEYLQKKMTEVNEYVAELVQELILLEYSVVKETLSVTRESLATKEAEAEDNHRKMIKALTRAFGHSEGALTADNIHHECDMLYSKSLPRTSRSKPRELLEASLDMLHERRQYQEWQRRGSSCLLLLGGNNVRTVEPSRPSWLTRIASQFYLEAREAPNTRAVLCSLLTFDHRRRRTPDALLEVALKSILVQLLQGDQRLSRLHGEQICDVFGRAAVKRDSLAEPAVEGEDVNSVLWTLFEDVLLTTKGPTTLYIIVDGIDKLIDTQGTETPEDFFRHWFEILGNLELAKNGVLIKLLIICYPRRWPNLLHRGSSPEEKAKTLAELKEKLGRFAVRRAEDGMDRVLCDLEWAQPL